MYRKSMRKALQEARAYRDPLQEDKGFSSQQIKMAYGVLNDPRYKQGNYSGAAKAIEKIAKGLSNHPDVANALKRANEETITEFKKMVVTIKDPVKRNQAMQDIMRFGKRSGSSYVICLTGPLGNKRPFRIDKMSDGKSFRIDGKGADLNKFATDMKNYYGAEIKAESVEELDEALEVKWDSNKQGWFDKQGRRRYLGKMATNKLMSKAIDKAKETGDFINPFKLQHGQKPEEVNTDTYADSKKKMLNKEEVVKEAFSKNDFAKLEATNDHTEAAVKLIEISKGKVAGFVFVINLFDLGGCDNLLKKGYKFENLIEFPGH